MPRASSGPKRQQGAVNQRDTRHENGLVGPGKRVQKQKSNGHLNGHPRTPETPSSTPPLPSTPPSTNGHVPQPSILDDIAADRKMAVAAMRRPSVSVYSESSSSESYSITPVNSSHEIHRRIDVNAAKNPAVHRDSGPVAFVLTVLKSCPLYDTIAILIVLLQIPPTFLSIIHLLFASLTFVPPSSATSTGLNFTDIFEGTHGTPSLATIVFVDVFVLLIWLFLWSPLQEIALDLAQTVIALTLGGGTSGREAGMNNVLVCLGIIGVSHFARSGSDKPSGLRAIISSSRGLIGSTDSDDPLESISQGGNRKDAHGWIRSILAIHILAQGVVRYIRDWYVRRERRDISASSIGDPEAAKGLPDIGTEATMPHPQTPESEVPNVLASHVLTTKKKRKQSAQVRMRQPLWAALASTKIVMVKEYETSHTAAESAGTNATDINNLGNAPFNTEPDRIWITYVGPDEVFFSTSYFPAHCTQNIEERNCLDSQGIDKSKPFFVRVNQAIWQPTRIHPIADELIGRETRWTGEIFGLAPMSSYECDFISTVDGSLIFSTSVRTLQPPTDTTAASQPPNIQVPVRPGSPTTTLKSSIATSEVRLADELSRQKREKKEQRAKINSARRDIKELVTSISSSGGSDDKLRQKVQQNNLHMKQAEDALETLDSQIALLENIPSDETALYTSSKSNFQSEKALQKSIRTEFNNFKASTDRQVSALTNELSTLEQRREKLEARKTKLVAELDRVTDANARGLDAAQRQASERNAKEAERRNIEKVHRDHLVELEFMISEYNIALTQINTEIVSLGQMGMGMDLYTQNPSPASTHAQLQGPAAQPYVDIPEGGVVAGYPWGQGVGYGALGNTVGPSGALLGTLSSGRRGRSSSMLSNVSGFTQSSSASGNSVG
ncbi:hypothetical protein B7494_g8383 [Chlorociboria aeruginascens]|nr:hypothetical protein B7494_g8383 [Chlorociboria aeruginascens]